MRQGADYIAENEDIASFLNTVRSVEYLMTLSPRC